MDLEAGYDALVTLRNAMEGSTHTKIVVHGKDGRDRMLEEVVTKTMSDDRFCSNGLRAVRVGYSFAATLTGTPMSYKAAECNAQEAHKEVWRDPRFHTLRAIESLQPWSLKRLKLKIGECTKEEHDTKSVEIHNGKTRLNESNIFVVKSSINRAGLGLLIRAPTEGRLTIPSGTIVTTYARAENTEEDSDYFIHRDHGGRTLSFDARLINGENMGRFVNQGELGPLLKLACQLYTVNAPRDWIEVERCARKHTNSNFVSKRNIMYNIQTSKTLTLECYSKCEELLINYGINDF